MGSSHKMLAALGLPVAVLVPVLNVQQEEK